MPLEGGGRGEGGGNEVGWGAGVRGATFYKAIGKYRFSREHLRVVSIECQK